MTESRAQLYRSLVVFSDDWGRHPSSCQHVIRRLLPRYRVLWVNTIGTRAPRLDGATLRRAGDKLRAWLRPVGDRNVWPANLTVTSPRMWPWFSRPHDRWLNRLLLLRSLTPQIQSLPGPIAAITTVPIVADLVGRLPVDRWVYYCVDDFSQWPGLDQRTMRETEQRLIPGMDRIIAVSEPLQQSLAERGRQATLLTHGVDLAMWSEKGSGLFSGRDYPKPWVVFWGVVDRRMDTSFVRRLGEQLGVGTILLVGPAQEPDPELLQLPRVAMLPPLPYQQLPALAAAASVLIMPYTDSPVTRAMQPLKLKEYLASGRPAVVRDLPAVAPWRDCLDVAGTPEQFSAHVLQRIAGGLPEGQRQSRRCLAQESWEAKAEQFERDGLW